ncbi:hypothetical protein Tdes44962_MAKER02664 [Teratosphaeria destructans]|uniref:Uncharacterized protein n=1 Tax=Teratosphaeria destructans TaxID=418781 RepID=A0A9W7SSV3_9PEZI|nr:hypothetical protein Tdes44962_MAKER02664 [Teratosphaeria destructans]
MKSQRRKSESLGGLGRAFSKLRATIKRRGTSKDNVPVLAETTAAAAADTTPPPEPKEQRVATDVVGKSDTEDEKATSAAITPHLDSSILEAEGVIDVDDEDQSTEATATERGKTDEDKAQELFRKYGLQYTSRSPRTETLPTKSRRVEKPVRMRVHWKCHQCQGGFSREKTCLGCGHRRCEDCIRSPPRKLREAMVRTSQEQMQPAYAAQPAVAAPVLDLPAPNTSSAPELPPEPLAADQTETEDEAEAKYAYGSFWTRPRTSGLLVIQPKKQLVRRQCHQCDVPFLPASRTECENCQHTRCSLCPRRPVKSEKWARGSSEDALPPFEDAPMVRAVQRVYKKPRQRVRYTCDQCQAILIDRRTCAHCGHDRCETCTRYPPKKERVPDPAIVQAVIDRLGAYHLASDPPQRLVAAA